MTLKLGALLVQEGLITPRQLDEALRYQAIFGGRLGTNLMEMGLAREEDIARVLSAKLEVPYVGSAELLGIDAHLLALIPAEVARRQLAVPFRLEEADNRLHVAMLDPADLKALDELALLTGYAIRPVVAPEVSLLLALEKHYHLERDPRYEALILRLQRNLDAGVGATPARPFAGASANWRNNVARHSIDELSSALSEVRDRDHLAAIILGYLDRRFERAALFLVRQRQISGWQAHCDGRILSDFTAFSLTLNEPSMLRTVIMSRGFFIGAPANNPANLKILHALGQSPAETALLIPVVRNQRVVCILYAAGGTAQLTGEFFELQQLAQKAALALDILILRNKIRMT